jgi:hypothetical protein
MGPNARALYDRFEEMIGACGAYHIAPAKTRIAFLAQVRFAGITRLNESEMVCNFALPKPVQAGGCTGFTLRTPPSSMRKCRRGFERAIDRWA